MELKINSRDSRRICISSPCSSFVVIFRTRNLKRKENSTHKKLKKKRTEGAGDAAPAPYIKSLRGAHPAGAIVEASVRCNSRWMPGAEE